MKIAVIKNQKSYPRRIKLTKEYVRLPAKSHIQVGVSDKIYRQLRLVPDIDVAVAADYDLVPYNKLAVENSELKIEVKSLQNKVALLEEQLKKFKLEFKKLRELGLGPDAISHLLNVKYSKASEKFKLAMFEAIIEDNVEIRKTMEAT